MSALSEGSTPAHDTAPASLDAQQLHHIQPQQHPPPDSGLQSNASASASGGEGSRKRETPPPFLPADANSAAAAKAPSVRRACTACHSGKTRCSEVLPCQSCLKRGLGQSCTYPDPDAPGGDGHPPPIPGTSFVPSALGYQPPPPPPQVQPNLAQQHYYDYNGAFTGASTSTFRPNKRPRTLTEEEAAAITRGFSRGDFYVGTSAPVRIDPRLPVRLTLGEGDQVHFTVGEQLV
ncbi:hypothetical protein HWV62_22708 [Athelia sp. TMB]|nr:hypothetical protein HWV62_22708 [Athelia sp. TMB]